MANIEDVLADPNAAATIGADWAGYGVLSGPQLITLMTSGRLRAVFADNGILVEITRADDSVGVYRVAEAGEAVRFLPRS